MIEPEITIAFVMEYLEKHSDLEYIFAYRYNPDSSFIPHNYFTIVMKTDRAAKNIMDAYRDYLRLRGINLERYFENRLYYDTFINKTLYLSGTSGYEVISERLT